MQHRQIATQPLSTTILAKTVMRLFYRLAACGLYPEYRHRRKVGGEIAYVTEKILHTHCVAELQSVQPDAEPGVDQIQISGFACLK